MKRYAIELNGSFVADANTLSKAKKIFDKYKDNYTESDNIIRLWDIEEDEILFEIPQES